MSAHLMTAAMVVGMFLAGALYVKRSTARLYAATEGEVRP